jgi:acyl-CoA synthetase (AMP-forming)/AMP-acid ligase II
MVEVLSHQHATSAAEEFTATAETLVSILRSRANRNPDRQVFTFLERGEREQASLTFGELDRRARAIANRLTSLQAKGERVVLLYPPGLEFIASFFGCLYAGAIAVPGYPPTRGHNHARLLALIRDAGAKLVLTVSDSLNALQHLLGDLIRDRAVTLLASDQVADAEAIGWARINIGQDAIAYIQYTSGSTSTPRGVIVRHGNIMHNQRMIGRAFGLAEGMNLVSWLPLFHDMGLVGMVEHSVYAGLYAILMSPLEFIHQPIRWLRAISRYNAHTSGGPNFGYDLCVKRIKTDDLAGLDLSCWKRALNGSEPVRAETMERFAAKFSNYGFKSSSFFPCYGLAEATLFVSGREATGARLVRTVNSAALEAGRFEESSAERNGSRQMVSCGKGQADQQIMIVDPQTGANCPAGTVGEIWVSGSHVAQGYWNRAEESAIVFQARLAETGAGPFLRTGDLGCLVDDELFITGRLKELIILCGRNHYPHDIEATVAASHSALESSCNAAFVVEVEGQEALVVVQEVRRSTPPAQAEEICAAMRQALAENHAINPHALVLVGANTIPKTSSGKIRRFACRAAFVDGTLSVFGSRPRASGGGVANFGRKSHGDLHEHN